MSCGSWSMSCRIFSWAADPPASGWTQGVFAPADSFVAQCASPRSGTDPDTGETYPDVPGSTLTENNWLRSWSNDLYLWYSEIVDRDPGLHSTPEYFELLKTSATTASGAPKDSVRPGMSQLLH